MTSHTLSLYYSYYISEKEELGYFRGWGLFDRTLRCQDTEVTV